MYLQIIYHLPKSTAWQVILACIGWSQDSSRFRHCRTYRIYIFAHTSLGGLSVVTYVINAAAAIKEPSLIAFMKGLWCQGTASSLSAIHSLFKDCAYGAKKKKDTGSWWKWSCCICLLFSSFTTKKPSDVGSISHSFNRQRHGRYSLEGNGGITHGGGESDVHWFCKELEEKLG